MRSPARGSIAAAHALLALALIALAAAGMVASFRVAWLIAASLCATAAAIVALFLLSAETRGRRMADLGLRRSEGRLRGILDSAMDSIITVDQNQRVVLFNDAAEAMFGWRRDEAIGTALDNFIPERFRHVHAAHVERFGRLHPAEQRRSDYAAGSDLTDDAGQFQTLHNLGANLCGDEDNEQAEQDVVAVLHCGCLFPGEAGC